MNSKNNKNNELKKLSVEALADELDLQVQNSGQGYAMVCCPAHDDNNPSLSLKNDEAGQAVVCQCFAGCDRGAVVDEFKKLGFDLSGSGDKKANKIYQTQTNAIQPYSGDVPNGIQTSLREGGALTHLYEYRDTQQQTLGYCARYETSTGKAVIPYFRQKGGRWQQGIDLSPRPLYGLDRLAEDTKKPVLIVEGEKAADAARQRLDGYVAITSSGGSNATDRSDWSPLAGRDVVIWPDYDSAGYKFAQRVAQLASDNGAIGVAFVDLSRLFESAPVLRTQGSDIADIPASIQLPEALPVVAHINSLPALPDPGKPRIDCSQTIDKQIHALDKALKAHNGQPVLFDLGGSYAILSDQQKLVSITASSCDAFIPCACTIADWTKTGKADETPIDPPTKTLKSYLAAPDRPGAASLDAIIDHPTMLPNGEILSKPGYHPDYQLLLRDQHGESLSLPDTPSQQDARQAYKTICDIFKTVPFERDAHQAAFVAALLTVILRPTINEPVPGLFIDAPVRASGKTNLANSLGWVISGDDPCLISPPSSGESDELRKKITSTVTARKPFVVIDNVSGRLGRNPTLDALLTANTWTDRMLGGNTMVKMPMRTVWAITGNNVQIVGDLSTRLLPIRLDPQTERPEQKAFTKPLKTIVLENRRELLTAALTLCRAYYVAGSPDLDLLPVRYREWDCRVRHPVYWASGIDPAKPMADLAIQDEDTIKAAALLEAIERVFGTDEWVTKDLLDPQQGSIKDRQALTEALEDNFGSNNDNTRVIGSSLSKLKNRHLDGRQLCFREGRARARYWSVQPASYKTPNLSHETKTKDDKPCDERPVNQGSDTNETHSKVPPIEESATIPFDEACGDKITVPWHKYGLFGHEDTTQGRLQ